MSRQIHSAITNIVADHVNFIHETDGSGSVKFNTTGNFHMVKPITVPSVILDEYKIIKSDSSLVIQKLESGSYRTLMRIS